MQNFLVSVIITTYNRSVEVLGRAINSVIAQSYSPIEILVVDDNKDELINDKIQSYIYKKNCNVIKYLKNHEVHGACAARNNGAKHAVGDVIAFLDDDDVWHPHKLEVMVPQLSAEIGLVYCNATFIHNGKRILNKAAGKKVSGDPFKEILKRNYIGGCSFPIMKKSVFMNAGMFDTAMPASQDIDLWIRILKITKISYVSEKLVDYYISDDAISRNVEKQILGRKRILSKYSDDYETFSGSKDHYINVIVISLILLGQYKNSIKEFHEYYRKRPIAELKYSYIIIKGFIKVFLNRIRGYN